MAMKSTGMIRKVDELGRVVLPMELRRVLGIAAYDPIEIFTEGNYIVLKKYEPGCVFCGETPCSAEFEGKHICTACMARLPRR